MTTLTVCKNGQERIFVSTATAVNHDDKEGILVSAADRPALFVWPGQRSELMEHRDALRRFCRIHKLTDPWDSKD